MADDKKDELSGAAAARMSKRLDKLSKEIERLKKQLKARKATKRKRTGRGG
jgi:uncharacterized small protein (DUF1192 family)